MDSLFVKIVIYKGAHPDKTIYYRNSLPMRIVSKWKWYFEYLAALVKVNNPRNRVELTIGEQGLLQGKEYIEEKTKTKLRSKKAQLKKLEQPIIDDDLFCTKARQTAKKKSRLISEIQALENGEFNYYVPPTYINEIKKYIGKRERLK